MSSNSFQQVVFAGGGNRCVWQAGFWQIVAKEINLQPHTITAVSAGAAISCLILAGLTERSLAYFKKATARNKKNAYFSRLFSSQPIFPHAQIYRQAILDLVDDNALKRLHEGPDINVLVARIPKYLGQRTALLVGGLAYTFEHFKNNNQLHSSIGQRLGFSPEVFSVKNCQTPSDLADLLLASSCTPPFTPALVYQKGPVLDGGMIDSVPVKFLPKKEKSLILLTKRYDTLPQCEHYHYIQPSEVIPVDKWDYTSPDKLQIAYELGKKDGLNFLHQQS